MAEFTFLKLQLDDASFSANAPFATTGDSEEGTESTGEEAGGSPSLVPFFVGLLFLLVVALAARRFLGGSDESLESQDI